MTITPEHAAAMRLGRERQAAEAQALRVGRHEMYSHWVKRDARLWRNYRAAVALGEGVDKARDEWKANLDLMPSLDWAGSV